MIITLTYTKDEIFKLISDTSIYLSDPLGEKDTNRLNRVGDVIPVTEDDRSFFDVVLFDIGNKILKKLAYDVADIDVPFVISGNDDEEYPDPLIIYRFNLFTGANDLIIVPQVQQAVSMALVNGILAEWLTVKNYFQQAAIVQAKFEQALLDIKSALMYGQTATKTYRTF